MTSDLHPIVAQMQPSPEQAPAVTARGRDVVVTAGAGTGKTRALVARYLSLLVDDQPRRAVAVTFTRKAAREMRNRVRQEVRRYLGRPDLLPAERDRWQELYTALDAARIGTIHSLCTEILRGHPAEAAVDPRFEVLEEGQMSILRGRAVDETLAWAAEDDEAVGLFALLGERGFRDTLDTLIRQRLDVEGPLKTLPDDVWAHWQQVLSERQREALEALLSRPEWRTAVATLESCASTDPDDRMALQREAALAAIGEVEGPLADQLVSLSRLQEIKLTGGRQAAWPGGKAELNAVKQALRDLRTYWRDNAGLLELTLSPLDETLETALARLRTAFRFACRRYDALKRERNGLDFDDLESAALALLQGNAAVQQRWQREVRALLVDEFQDTNRRQRDLVRLLTGDEGKLFMVGDAKQSIYRFRGANVAVFRQEREETEATGGAVFALQTSYRAHAELVHGLNDLLRPVLGQEADPSRPWAEPFAALVPHREKAGPGFTPPHVELHMTVGSKGGGALGRAAGALAARIRELVDGGLQVEGEGAKLRPVGYGDVAILCRASTSFGAYEDGLERALIPFLTVAGRGFYGRPEIRDLLNGLRALADPMDDLALVGLLRSPAFALSDAALYLLARAREQEESDTSLWEALGRAGSELPGADGPRAERAARLITALHDQVGRSPVADLLKAFLDETDYRAGLIRSGGGRAARNVSKLLADAHTSRIVGVGEFLKYVNGMRDAGSREGEARTTSEGAVQIMSVHAAKGLEFPVVVLGDVTYVLRGRNSLIVDPELGILLPLKDEDDNLPAIYRLAKIRADDQEEAESDRLLYVAATRAREKLILSGCFDLKRDGTPRKLGGWLGKIDTLAGLELAGTSLPYNVEGTSAMRFNLRVGGTPVACTVYEPGIGWPADAVQRLAVAPELTALPPPLLQPVPAVTEEVDEPVAEQDRVPRRRVWRVVPTADRPRAPAWVVGSVVHEALASWRFPDGGFEHWAEARAKGYGITDSGELTSAIRQSRRLLTRFREHSLFDEMDQAERRLHEVPYSLDVGGRVENGIIDALYLQDGTWRIVEFKTDRVKDDADFEKLRKTKEKDYVTQAQRYAAAVEQLLGQRPRWVLCMLNWDRHVRLLADEEFE